MRRATITVPDELDERLGAFMDSQAARPSLTSLVEAALEAYLAGSKQQSRLPRVMQHRAEIKAAAARYGATKVALFGSVAEGNDGPDSDIDFWIEHGAPISLFDLAALRGELSDMLSERIDLLTLGGLSAADRDAVERASLVL